MRPGDHIARYGGEEFVCLLPETGFAGAMQLAEQIRKEIVGQQIEHADSSVAPFVTVSLGVGSKPEQVHAKCQCFDEPRGCYQLYRAKKRAASYLWR